MTTPTPPSSASAYSVGSEPSSDDSQSGRRRPGDRTSLGDYMKAQESVYKAVLPRRTYTIIRLDGRGFHNYCRGLERPFDSAFASDMDETAKAVCADASGVALAYVQSDEISVLLTDFAAPTTQAWFGGEVQKIVSVSAARATSTLNRLRPDRSTAMFDSRVFTLADPADVARYFIWRQRDCVRNSISMTAQANFSHKSLHGLNTDQMQERLWAEAGVNWNDMPDGFKRGRWIVKESGPRPVTYTRKDTGETISEMAERSWWEAQAAPHFTVNGLLDCGRIPARPEPRERVVEVVASSQADRQPLAPFLADNAQSQPDH